MAQQSSLRPSGRAVGSPPDSLVRLVSAALVRLATAALALVVAMLVINPLASGRPLQWNTFSSTLTEHLQPSGMGGEIRLFDDRASHTYDDGYLEGLAKAVN
jgi:hypothetical protein